MSKSLDLQTVQRSSTAASYDAVVVGAGPYGLSTSAHLQDRGLKVAILGKPFQLWRENMPEGMLLRSYWWATNLSDPHRQYGLGRYFRETGQQPIDPLPAKTLIDYGLWFQKHVVPNVDETYVKTIAREDGHFVLTLTDGRVLQSAIVVMAPGLNYYTYRPAEYDHLPAQLVSHSSEQRTFDRFADKEVIIIGAGQSALETAALAHESGVRVQVVCRRPIVWIKGEASLSEHRPPLERLRHPKAGISSDWFSWQLEHFPYYFQRLPRPLKDRLLYGIASYGPMGAAWLKPRLQGKVALHELQQVQHIQEVNSGVALTLSNNKVLRADHIILGTGYRTDIRRLSMLHPSLVSAIQTYHHAPILQQDFQTSVPGLYFVGFSSLSSCGPLYRFVLGTDAAARRLASSIARQALQMRRK
jgi:FAD-dependent urate hydroxylase